MKALILCDGGKVEKVAPLCITKGFGIEVQSFHQPNVLEDHTQVGYHLAQMAGISLRAMHGPFGDLCPGSFDPMVCEVARVRLEQAYAIARQLDIDHIVLHHGYVPHTSSRAGWIRRSMEFWHSFLAGKSPEVHFYLENLLELDPSIISDVIDGVGSHHLSINLDIGHAHCNSQTPVLQWIEAIGNRIGYLHLHDNHGEADEHLGLGQGQIPMLEVCHALNEYSPDAIWAIEAEGEGINRSLLWLIENGFLSNEAPI